MQRNVVKNTGRCMVKKTSRMKTQNWNSFTSLLYGIYNNLMTRSIFHLTQSFCADFSCSTKYRRNKFTECAGVCKFVGQLAHRKCYLLFSVCSRGKKKESNIGLIVSSRQGLQYLPGIFHLVHGKYKHISYPASTYICMIHAFRTLELNQIHLKGKRQWRVPGRKKNSDEQQKRSKNNKALRRTPIKIDKRWTVFLHNFYMWKVVVAIVDFFFVLFVFLSFTLLAVSRDGMRRWMRWALAINYYRFIAVWDICEMHTKWQLIMYCLYIFHEAKQHSNTHQKNPV